MTKNNQLEVASLHNFLSSKSLLELADIQAMIDQTLIDKFNLEWAPAFDACISDGDMAALTQQFFIAAGGHPFGVLFRMHAQANQRFAIKKELQPDYA